MAVKVAINGFGRIGRLVFRLMEDNPNVDIVAINDLTDAETLTYLLKYDTSHRLFKTSSLEWKEKEIIIDGKTIPIYAEKDPANLPWGEKDVDVVFECTGHFTSKESAEAHIKAGAKKVLVSAPCKGDVKTIVYNVNHNELDGTETVVSAASCTTNCLAPVVKNLNDTFGIENGFMTTVHAYTNDQSTLDVPHRKGILSRRGRAAAANIIPTSTGAAAAIGKVLPELNGKLDGMAMRVPVTTGSVIDLTLNLLKPTTVDEVNNAFITNTNESFSVTNDPIVSSDIIGSRFGSVADLLSTKVLEADGKQIVKVVAWYDNEMSYSAQMVRTALYLGSLMNK